MTNRYRNRIGSLADKASVPRRTAIKALLKHKWCFDGAYLELTGTLWR